MSELVRGPHVIVRAIRAARARLVMRAITTIVLVAIILGSLGNRTSCPPAADDASESADQRADRTTDGSDCRASKAAGNSASRFADVISGRWIVVSPDGSRGDIAIVR